MDLLSADLFSNALLNLGRGDQSRGPGKLTSSEPGELLLPLFSCNDAKLSSALWFFIVKWYPHMVLEIWFHIAVKTHILNRLSLDFSGLVTLSIQRLVQRDRYFIEERELHKDYEKWITSQHHEYDTGPLLGESDGLIISTDQHKAELNITDDGEEASTCKKKHHNLLSYFNWPQLY